MKSVSIVQPYVPAYRVAFFERLIKVMQSHRVEIRVIAGHPRGSQLLRGDAQRPDWLVTMKTHELSLMTRTLVVGSSSRYWDGSDAVILPHMGSSIEASRVLLSRKRPRVGLWGHIAPYVSPGNAVDLAIERWQLRRCDRVFAYTEGGRDFAINAGVDERRVTTVVNSIDTSELLSDMRALTPDSIDRFLDNEGIPAGRALVAFLGGLDASKRVDLLAEALAHLDRVGSNVHVLVGGIGSDIPLLQAAVERGQATLLGRVTGHRKAAMLAAAKAIVNPGRVGLVAVEALAAGLPVLTTDYPFHAPEIEYLEEGVSRFTSANSSADFARLMEDHGRFAGLPGNQWYPSLEAMCDNFASGVIGLLEMPLRQPRGAK